MNAPGIRGGVAVGLAMASQAALAATQDETLTAITELMVFAAIAIVVAAIAGTYFMKSRDHRLAPVRSVFRAGEAIHAVAPDVPVFECVRRMAEEKVGSLVVLDGTKLLGIFTERDALNKVLAEGRDPIRTKVSEVMTRDPCCVAPSLSIGEAMQLITRRRFRHLPVVEDGRLLAVVSSGDLTRWLIRDRLGEVPELTELRALG